MLWPAGVQSGKSRRCRRSWTTQRRTSLFFSTMPVPRQYGSRLGPQRRNFSTIGSADYFSGTVVLVDVRGRLSRIEDRERGQNRVALLPVREIRGRFVGTRAKRTSVPRA